MVNRVPKRERLMNLVAALLAAEAPLPFRKIAGHVVGYDDPAGIEALEKRFDRDKAELRRLGIPVEYRGSEGAGPGGYVIPQDRVFQQKVSFTPSEAVLLSIAGRVGASATGGGPLEEALKSALRKLAVDLDGFDPSADMTGVTVLRARTGDPRALENVSTLSQAVTGSRRVRFSYQSVRSGEVLVRTLDPYGLGLMRGAWYLAGHCHLRQAVRVFKVARIRGKVELLGDEDGRRMFEVPEDFRLEDHLDPEIWRVGEGHPVKVTLHAEPDLPPSLLPSQARVVATGPAGTIIEVEVRRPEALVSWVLAHSGKVVVVAPDEVRNAVAEAARTLGRIYREEDRREASAMPVPGAEETGMLAREGQAG